MKNLKNALLLKQLYQLEELDYKYTNLSIITEDIDSSTLPPSIEKINKIISNCTLCKISCNRDKVVLSSGDVNSNIMFIGDQPNLAENSIGDIFGGKAGDMLTLMIEKVLEIPKDNVYISNILKCYPPDSRDPKSDEVDICLEYILKEIKIIKPKIIITLGIKAYNYLTNETKIMSDIQGKTIQKGNYIIIPTLHPSYLLRNPSLKKEVLNDLLKVKRLNNENK